MKIKNEKIFSADIYSGDILRGEKLHRHHVIMVKFANLYVPIEPFIKNCLDYFELSLYIDDLDEFSSKHSAQIGDYRFYSDQARRENLEGLCFLKNVKAYTPNKGKTSLKELYKKQLEINLNNEQNLSQTNSQYEQ